MSRIGLGASRPLRDADRIRRLFRERLSALEGHLEPGYGYDLIRLSVLASAPYDDSQGDLHGTAGDAGSELALFEDRVRARLGRTALQRPRLAESHWPERTAPLVPAIEGPPLGEMARRPPRPDRNGPSDR